MTNTKRTILTVLVVAALLVVIAFTVLLWIPAGAGVFSALHDVVVLRVLCSLACVIALVGVVYALIKVIGFYVHAVAQLSAGDEGSISIERNALISVARRALDAVPGIEVQALSVDVVQRRGVAVLDVKVTATPGTDASLMSLASTIQSTVKTKLEQFTEHEVRYVAVNFVEPRKHEEDVEETKAGDESAQREKPAVVQNQNDPSPAESPVREVPARETSAIPDVPGADDTVQAPSPSVPPKDPSPQTSQAKPERGRFKAWLERRRSEKPHEVVVDAIAQDVTDTVGDTAATTAGASSVTESDEDFKGEEPKKEESQDDSDVEVNDSPESDQVSEIPQVKDDGTDDSADTDASSEARSERQE